MNRHEYKKIFEHGKKLEQLKLWGEATVIYDQVIDAAPEFVHARRRRAECLMRLQRWSEAEQDVRSLFDGNMPIINRDVRRMVTVCSQQGRYTEAAQIIADFSEQWLKDNEASLKKGLVLLTAAVPKTGSTSLSLSLAAATGLPRCNFLCYQNSPMGAGVPSIAALYKLKDVGIVNHCHLVPDESLLLALRNMPWVRVAIQFRHPAETLLSTIDMMVRDQTPIIFAYSSVAPDAPVAEISEWVISHYLPRLVTWIEGWVAAIDDGHPSILGWTTLDEIKCRGQDTVARQMLKSAGIEPLQNVTTDAQRTGLRLRGPEEITFSKEQYDRVLALIPHHLRERFDW